MARLPWWVWASVLACAVAALPSLAMRHRVEQANRAVGLMMEMSDVEGLALAAGVPTSEALAALKAKGLTGVAITEETIQDLIDRQIARWEGDVLVSTYTGPTFSSSSSIGAFRRAVAALRERGIGRAADIEGDWVVPRVTTSRDAAIAVMRTPIGIDPSAIRAVTDAGLIAIARHYNEPGIRRDIIATSLKASADAGATAYLIGGDEAIGNRDHIGVTAGSLRVLEMDYLSPEFVVLGGDAFLRRSLKDRTIRLHSISQIEGERMSPGEFRERMAKAYRERDVRWLLMRPTSKSSEEPLNQMGETLSSLRLAIERVGGEVKPPRPFEEPGAPDSFPGLIALFALPAVCWALVGALGKNWFSLTCCALSAIACGAAFLDGYEKYAALVVATVFPVAGFLFIAPEGKPLVRSPILSFLAFSFFSVVGGLCVGGMLVGLDYMLRNDAFVGVKFAMFVPVLVVGWMLLRAQGPVGVVLNRPVTWLAATVALAGLAIIGLVALRSGNENPTAVSSLELQVRALLDNLLHVRPRSKEVAFGHPAMMLGLFLAAFRPSFRGWSALLLLAGVVGQTSIVNTMCHLHTPVLLSLSRIGIGLALGGIIGLLVWLVARRWIPKMETAD